MKGAIDRFVGPYHDLTTDFVDAYSGITQNSYDRLSRAQIVVAQAALQSPKLGHEHIPAGVPVHLVPVVNGSFLYPYQGELHPANPMERYGSCPFMPEYNDRFLASLYIAKISPAEALDRYRAHNVATAAKVGRRFEIAIEGQRELDAKTGYAVAELIECHIADEQLFQTAYHFQGRIARHLAAALCDRLGFDAKYGQRIRDFLAEGPFTRLYVPVHPSIARFFGMRWMTAETRYPYRYEGAFTFDEYVLRFMEVKWSEMIEEGVIDALHGRPEAKAKLEAGLLEAPGSARAAHELSCIVEREGDLARAIALQQRAVGAYVVDWFMPLRLGNLLRRAGDLEGAERAFQRATELDPVHGGAWYDLRDSLIALNRLGPALIAARKAAVFARDPAEALDVVFDLERRIAGK